MELQDMFWKVSVLVVNEAVVFEFSVSKSKS